MYTLGAHLGSGLVDLEYTSILGDEALFERIFFIFLCLVACDTLAKFTHLCVVACNILAKVWESKMLKLHALNILFLALAIWMCQIPFDFTFWVGSLPASSSTETIRPCFKQATHVSSHHCTPMGWQPPSITCIFSINPCSAHPCD